MRSTLNSARKWHTERMGNHLTLRYSLSRITVVYVSFFARVTLPLHISLEAFHDDPSSSMRQYSIVVLLRRGQDTCRLQFGRSVVACKKTAIDSIDIELNLLQMVFARVRFSFQICTVKRIPKCTDRDSSCHCNTNK